MFPLAEDVSFAERSPFVWSFRRPARSPLFRFFAQLLIRLLIVTPLPEQLQVAAALFPVSMLWPLVRLAAPAQEGGAPQLAEPAAPGSEGNGGVLPGRSDPAGVEISDVLVTPDLTVIVSSQPQASGGGKATIVGGLTSITGGAPLRLFHAGTLTGIGSRMALTKDGILVSSDRTYIAGTKTSENGVNTAALGSMALIQKIDPPAFRVDFDGKSVEPVTVTYRLIAPPPKFQGGRIKLWRNDQVLGEYPAVGLGDGVYELTIPPGVAMNPPPTEWLEIRVVNPDGTTGQPAYEPIVDAGSPGALAQTIVTPEPLFESLSPAQVLMGSGDLHLRISGRHLEGVKQAFVRSALGDWTAIDTLSRSSSVVTLKVPAALLAGAGLVVIAPKEEGVRSVALLVVDGGLPQPGTAQGISLSAVTPSELMLSTREIRISGSGLTEGMKAVIGRGGTTALTTIEAGEDQIIAEIPGCLGKGDDLFVAVLTEDGSGMSSPLPLRSTCEPETVDVSSLVPAGKVAISNVRGPVVWQYGAAPGDEQEIEIDGMGLEPGMQVMFARRGDAHGSLSRTARPSRRPPPTPSAPTSPPTASVSVKVPKELPATPDYVLTFEPNREGTLMATAPKRTGAQPPAEISLGGRVKFVAFRQEGSKKLLVYAQPDPVADDFADRLGCLAAPAPTPTPTPTPTPAASPTPSPSPRVVGAVKPAFVPPAEVTFSLAANQRIAHPFGTGQQIDLVQQETSCVDPDRPNVFYLRGVRVTRDNADVAKVRAVATDQQTGQQISGELEVVVRAGALGGGTTTEVNTAILNAAGRTGIPPQFLKAQAEKEARTPFEPDSYRYEPTAWDIREVSGDMADQRNHPAFRRYVLAGSAVARGNGATQTWCKLIRGPDTPDAPWPPLLPESSSHCSSWDVTPPAVAGQTTFKAVAGNPATIFVQGRQGLPSKEADYRSPHPKATRYAVALPAPEPSPSPGGSPSPTPPLPGPASHRFVEGTYYRPIDKARGTTWAPPLEDNDFSFNYVTNTLTIKQPLLQGQWLHLEYSVWMSEPQRPTGECNTFPISRLNGKARRPGKSPRDMVFTTGDSIAGFIASNVKKQGGYNWLIADTQDQFLDFPCHGPNDVVCQQVNDRRYALAQAQFLAAGSYGMWQAGPIQWTGSAKAAVLNAAFDKCLYDLIDESRPTRIQEAADLVAASHSYEMRNVSETLVGARPWNELQWAQYWARVFEKYNPGGPEYSRGPKKDEDGPQGVNGMSRLIRRGLKAYGPDSTGQ